MKTIAIALIVLCVIASAAVVSAQNRNITVAHPVDRPPVAHPVDRPPVAHPVEGVPSGPIHAIPTLVDARIRFYTNDEDKDSDTRVNVKVEDFNQVIVAWLNDYLEYFDDHSIHGYSLETLNASTRDDLQRGRVTIAIQPTGGLGHDTWRFGFLLQLVFSDGTTLAAQVDGLELSQDRQQQTFGLQGILRDM